MFTLHHKICNYNDLVQCFICENTFSPTRMNIKSKYKCLRHENPYFALWRILTYKSTSIHKFIMLVISFLLMDRLCSFASLLLRHTSNMCKWTTDLNSCRASKYITENLWEKFKKLKRFSNLRTTRSTNRKICEFNTNSVPLE